MNNRNQILQAHQEHSTYNNSAELALIAHLIFLQKTCNKSFIDFFGDDGFNSHKVQSVTELIGNLDRTVIESHIEKKLGPKVGKGLLFNVVSPINNKVYMVKQYANANIQEIQREITALEKFQELGITNGAGVTKLMGCLHDQDNTFILMEQGFVLSSLGGISSDEFPITYNPEQRKEIFLKMALAVKHVHDKGIFHGYIQPDNFFMNLDASQLRLSNFQFSFGLSENISPHNPMSFCPYLSLYNLYIKADRQRNDLVNLIQSFMVLDPNIYLNLYQEIVNSVMGVSNMDDIKTAGYIQILNPNKASFIDSLTKIANLSCEKRIELVEVNPQPVQNNATGSMNIFGSLNSNNLFNSFGNNQPARQVQTQEVLVTYCNPLSQLYIDVINQGFGPLQFDINAIVQRLYQMDTDPFFVKEYTVYSNGVTETKNNQVFLQQTQKKEENSRQ